jgi:hypothetical protein
MTDITKEITVYRTNKTGTFPCGPYKCEVRSEAFKKAMDEYGDDWSYHFDLIGEKKTPS